MITFSGLQDESAMASLFKCDFSYNSVAVDKVSTDSTLHSFSVTAEPLVTLCRMTVNSSVGNVYARNRSEA